AHALAQVGICVPATAGLHPDQVILATGRARAVLPEQAPAVVAGGLFVAELDGVDARAERDARRVAVEAAVAAVVRVATVPAHDVVAVDEQRSEEHTSELQSRENLVCRRVREKKNKTK